MFPLKFLNVQIKLFFENIQGNKNLFKVQDKKDTRTASVNLIQMFLWLAGNMFLKSVGEPVLSFGLWGSLF